MPMKKVVKHKHGSKSVVSQIHEKLESTLPLERPSHDPSIVYASNLTAHLISQQHSQHEAQNLSGCNRIISLSSLGS